MPLPPEEIDARLARHLQVWLGRWPSEGPVDVVAGAARERPGWDGRPSPFVGVSSPGGTVVSVSQATLAAMGGARSAASVDELLPALRRALGRPDGRLFTGVFRWTGTPSPLPDLGSWVSSDDHRLPEWLRPFEGDVLVSFSPEGDYAAGLGLKRHDPIGRELAVGTDERHRGKGLARALVAQAARRVLAEGGLPTYLHSPDNGASAAVADAAGFADRGWRILGISGSTAT